MRTKTQRFGIFLGLIIILIAFNFFIYQKEKILHEGESIYLELIPIDPRSIMQGDYMNFRYQLINQMQKQKPKIFHKSGYAVITLDTNRVGHFARFYQGETLNQNEKLIKYNIPVATDTDQIYIINPHTYFFQEGQSSLYSQAKYAIFHYRGSKDYLLVGLADKDFLSLSERTKIHSKKK